MAPRSTNYLRQNIVFSYPEMIRVSFSLFLSLSVFCYFTLLLIFVKIILLLLFFFHENYFYFFMFRDVPECSGMFRNVPCSGFYRRPKRMFIELLARMCNVVRLGSEVCNWLPASYLEKKEYSLHSAFCTQPAFYSQSAVCILHSLCILPLVRSLQSAVRSLHFTLTVSISVLSSHVVTRVRGN